MQLIYIDTEFTNFAKPALISIGAVADDGSTFYAEITDYPKNTQTVFVEEVVVPLLDPHKHGMRYVEAGARFAEWLSERGSCQLCCDYYDDWSLAKQLLDVEFPDNVQDDYVDAYVLLRQHMTQHFNGPPTYEQGQQIIEGFEDCLLSFFVATNLPQHHALNDAHALKYALNTALTKLLY